MKTEEAERSRSSEATSGCGGFQQKPGLSYSGTDAPTSNASSIRPLAGLAVKGNIQLSHFGIQQAFVQGPIGFEVCTKLPPGCCDLTER